jgi:hypothetical protein
MKGKRSDSSCAAIISSDGGLDGLCYSLVWSLFDERIVMKEL